MGSEGFLVTIKKEKEKLIISIDLLQRSLHLEIGGASVGQCTYKKEKKVNSTKNRFKAMQETLLKLRFTLKN